MKEYTFLKNSKGVDDFNKILLNNCQLLVKTAAKYGYKIEYPFWKDLYGKGKDFFLSLEIEQSSSSGKYRYLPNIYIDKWGKMPKFTIQTTSYGELDASTFKDFIEMQNNALAFVKFLEGYDWKTLPNVIIGKDSVQLTIK